MKLLLKHLTFNMLFLAMFFIYSCQSEGNTDTKNTLTKQGNTEQAGSGISKDTVVEDSRSNLLLEQSTSFTYQPISNNSDSSNSNIINFSDLLPKKQSFILDPSQDNIITTKSGVKLFIPANSLLNKKGDLITNNIDFEVTEFLNYSEMLAAKLTTTSEKGHLESGGMFLLEAYQGDEKLNLKKYREIIIQTPNELDKNMMIYYAKKDKSQNTIWERDETSNLPYPTMVCKSGRFCGITKSFFEYNFRFTKKNMLALESNSMQYSLSFDNKGYVIGSAICKDPDYPIKNEACSAFMKLANSLRDSFPNKMNSNHKVIFEFEVLNYENYEEYRRKKREEWLAYEAKLEREKNSREIRKSIIEVAREDNNAERFVQKGNRSLFIGELILFNIDMNIDLPQAPKTSILVRDKGSRKEMMLFLRNKRTYLNAKYTSSIGYEFDQLPINKNAVLVCCYKENGTLYYSNIKLKTTAVNKYSISDFKFEEITDLNELKEKLNQI